MVLFGIIYCTLYLPLQSTFNMTLEISLILKHFKDLAKVECTYLSLAFTVCSPDPYVTVQILGTPNGAKKTRHVPNTSDPEWNETLDFYIDPKRDRFIGKSNAINPRLEVGL